MKTFEIKTLGLEELSGSELQIEGGGVKEALKKFVKGITIVGAWEWVNEHWDALVEGLERGCEEGSELYGC